MNRRDAEVLAREYALRRVKVELGPGRTRAQAERAALAAAVESYGSSLTRSAQVRIRRALREARRTA